MTQEQIFNVPGMDCGGCVRAITQAVHKLDPGAMVKADLATKRVQINGTGDFAAAITGAGFTVSSAG